MSRWRAFLRGFAMGCDPSLAFGRSSRIRRYLPTETPEEAIARDWRTVGDYLRRAMGLPAEGGEP